MKTQNARWFALASLVVGMGLSTSAQAVWTFGSLPANSTYSPSAPSAAGDPSVTLSGVYATNSTAADSTLNKVNGSWTAAALTSFGGNGLGIQLSGETVPSHALDNSGNTEAVLLNFSSSIVLSSIGLGYTSDGTCKASQGTAAANGCAINTTLNTGNQVDLSVFRWVGPGTPPNLVGKSAATNAGWELVGNYGDMAVDTAADPQYNKVNTGVAAGTGAAGAGGKGSSWWLISAYNSGFTQSTGAENRGSLDNANDYFKLYAVAGTVCTSTVAGVCNPPPPGKSVPEPGSMALASLALFGLAYSRRQAQRKS